MAKVKFVGPAKRKAPARSKSSVPPMLPRERLTRKAFAAVYVYATIRAGDLLIAYIVVKYTVQAERMRRVDLYAWLEARGYRWKSGHWEKAENGKDAG